MRAFLLFLQVFLGNMKWQYAVGQAPEAVCLPRGRSGYAELGGVLNGMMGLEFRGLADICLKKKKYYLLLKLIIK